MLFFPRDLWGSLFLSLCLCSSNSIRFKLTKDTDLMSVEINVGTLAILVIVVVSSSCVLVLLSLVCWMKFTTQSNIRCGRCHQIIGIRGVRLPPQMMPHYNVVVQPQQQMYHQQQFNAVGGNPNATASLMGLPGSRHPAGQEMRD